MVQINSMEDFEDRMLLDTPNFDTRTEQAADYACILEINATPYESSLVRLGRIVDNNSGSIPLYIKILDSATGASTAYKIGTVTLTMKFIRELRSVLLPYGIKILEKNNSEITDFDTSQLINTIKFNTRKDIENYIV